MDRPRNEEIQAHPTWPYDHAARVHAMPSELADGGLAERIVRHRTDHSHLMTKASQRHRYIRLGTTDVHLQLGRLKQKLAPRGAQSEEQFTETYDRLLHGLKCSPRRAPGLY